MLVLFGCYSVQLCRWRRKITNHRARPYLVEILNDEAMIGESKMHALISSRTTYTNFPAKHAFSPHRNPSPPLVPRCYNAHPRRSQGTPCPLILWQNSAYEVFISSPSCRHFTSALRQEPLLNHSPVRARRHTPIILQRNILLGDSARSAHLALPVNSI